MAKLFGVNTKISGKVGQIVYRQTDNGTVASELPMKPDTPLRTELQMERRTQWANLGAMYKLFDSRLLKGFENLPKGQTVYNAFVQANLGVVKVYLSKSERQNGGCVLAPYQITRGSLPSIEVEDRDGVMHSSIALGDLAIDEQTTVGLFTKAVVRNNEGYRDGDQLTFFYGRQSLDRVTGVPRATMRSSKITLAANDDRQLWRVASKAGFVSQGGVLAMGEPLEEGAMAWVHSREKEESLRVSTQFLTVKHSLLTHYQGSDGREASVRSYGGVNREPVYLTPAVAG